MKEEKYHDSRMIISTEYDFETKTLDICFNNNVSYAYYDFPITEYNAMIEADSIGKFFNEYIKNNYDCDSID